jgi:NTE family protein
MLGIGYVGFVWMLEAAGIRFLGLGGSSAGAITAGTIAITRERPDKPCSQTVLQVGD